MRPRMFYNFPQFRNFSQFSAIIHNVLQFSAICRHFSDVFILRTCWCSLLSIVNHTGVHNYAEQ